MTDAERIRHARRALRSALKVRAFSNATKRSPLCIFDVCENLGVEVRFVFGKSFEGMYSRTTTTILVATDRPPGRQAFTCAHELGHWIFNHGSVIDKLGAVASIEVSTPKEFLASMFATYLLMPPWTVKQAFDVRNWDVRDPQPDEIFIVASQLGVGYSTLIKHMYRSLRFIVEAQARQFLCVHPKAIRSELLDGIPCDHLIVADAQWCPSVPIDLRMGDYAIVPSFVEVEGTNVAVCGMVRKSKILMGQRTGISRVVGPNWACFVRVRRRLFEGRSIYRHLEDPDVDGAP